MSPAASLLTLDVLSGRLGLAPALPGGGALVYNRSWPWAPSSPFSFNLSLSVSDSSWTPSLYANGTARVTITRIAPRLMTTAFSFANNISSGATIANLSASLWSPYGGASFWLAASDVAVSGSLVPAFNVSSAGILSATSPLPSFNFNAKSSFALSVVLTDRQGTSSTVPVTLTMAHSNRAPVWAALPTYYTAAATNTTAIGSPLRRVAPGAPFVVPCPTHIRPSAPPRSVYVTDLDLGIVAEALTYSLTGAGNTGGTFGIDPATGRLFVAALGSAAFNYPGSFNLTACARDAGIDGPVYTTCSFVSIVLTQNQNPPAIPALNLTVAEGSPVGTLVAQINATSINPGAVLSYALSPGPALLNLPFPFSIATVNATPFNFGAISTTADSPLRYSPWQGTGNFRSYPVYVTATDSRLGFPLTTTVAASINVMWVLDGPFFDPAGQAMLVG